MWKLFQFSEASSFLFATHVRVLVAVCHGYENSEVAHYYIFTEFFYSLYGIHSLDESDIPLPDHIREGVPKCIYPRKKVDKAREACCGFEPQPSQLFHPQIICSESGCYFVFVVYMPILVSFLLSLTLAKLFT